MPVHVDKKKVFKEIRKPFFIKNAKYEFGLDPPSVKKRWCALFQDRVISLFFFAENTVYFDILELYVMAGAMLVLKNME